MRWLFEYFHIQVNLFLKNAWYMIWYGYIFNSTGVYQLSTRSFRAEVEWPTQLAIKWHHTLNRLNIIHQL